MVNGGELLEVLDSVILNIYGYLYEVFDGFCDVVILLKFGCLYVLYDDVSYSVKLFKQIKS